MKLQRWCCGLLLYLALPWLVSGQSNIVFNGGFELWPPNVGWSSDALLGGQHGEPGAAQGQSWTAVGGAYPPGDSIELVTNCLFGSSVCYITTVHTLPPSGPGSLWEDLSTVPGRVYRLKLALKSNGKTLRIHWGSEVVDTLENKPETLPESWYWTNYLVTAVDTTTRLRFESVLGDPYYVSLDAISVTWTEEPPSIIAQPQARVAREGGTAGFRAVLEGAPPLFVQWHRDDQVVPEATNATLVLTNVAMNEAGDYHVVITNAWGSVTSEVVSLTVERQPKVPEIVFQPQSQALPAGYEPNLAVLAIGEPPLQYQWRMNATPIPDATNASLAVAFATSSNIFDVVVNNAHGSVQSLGATITMTNTLGGALIQLANIFHDGKFLKMNPIYNLDGVTAVQGTEYSFQVYAGATETALRAVGPVRNDLFLGLFAGSMWSVPDVAPGGVVFAQVRVWENTAGQTYETARALGGCFGRSETFRILTSAIMPPPIDVIGISSFTLEAGLPSFSTGKIRRGQKLDDGKFEWILASEPGFRYVVERRYPPSTWVPIRVLTNVTGEVSFVDPDPQNASVAFYRTRILD